MSPFAKYFACVVLGVLLGAGAAASVYRTSVIPKITKAYEEKAQQDDRAKSLGRDTIGYLQEQLKQARSNAGAQLLATSGHVMNEQQCRSWVALDQK
jgi:hypothetical protein